jgi:DMSO/TMAO reductase YedYZ heme-binding membrane subunit
VNLLQHQSLNGWPLFFLIAALTFAGMMLGLALIGVSTPEASVNMIRLSVQFASPWIFIAFVTSALQQFFPGSVSSWLARNRRYTGLSFAAGFGWQAVFIAVLFALHASYYWEVLHTPDGLFIRIVSYLFLIAMTLTSFFPVRRKMRPQHWRWLHLACIWYFWAAIWVSYAGQALSSAVKTIDVVYTVLGLLVLVLRIAAYLKTRARKSSGEAPGLGAQFEHVVDSLNTQ